MITPIRTDHKNAESTTHDIQNVAQARVFVVDDDPVIHVLTQKILEKANFQYFGVHDAVSALSEIPKIQPDLILSDISMPGINGIEFCERLKTNNELKDIPVIFFTSHSRPEILTSAFEAGGCDYLTKPIHAFELASRAQHHITQYRRLKARHEEICLLDTKNQVMSKFLGVASHDLRNPLMSIRGISKYLTAGKFGELNDEQADLISTIQQTSVSMINLVDDLMEVSKFKASVQQIDPKLQKLDPILTLATTLYKAQAHQKGIHITYACKDAGPTAPINSKLITRVCDNLLSNAIKFSPSNTEITVLLYQDIQYAYISIADQGPGIPPDQFDRLFKEFSRTSVQPTAGESSNGLGLYLAKTIAEAHGGTISVRNLETGGAQFLLTLPLHECQQTEEQDSTASS